MLNINMVMENPEEVKLNLKKRNFDISIIDEIVNINEERKKITTEVETKRFQINQISKEVGKLKKEKADPQLAQAKIDEVTNIKTLIGELDNNLSQLKDLLNEKLLGIPNLVDKEVPEGEDESSNIEIFKTGEPEKFPFEPKDHVTLAENLGMLDFEAAAKITGSRFAFYKKDLAKMERALINFMIDQHVKNQYEEVIPPYIVHERALVGTGQLPKFKEDLFKIENHDWYMVPTAEVPLTNYKRDELFDGKELPIKMVAYTPCFRSEAGSYGKDTRGLIRLHQFNKVELVNIVAAEDSDRAHEEMINRARSILELLGLPYRGVVLSTGDIGFSAKKCVDIEVWLPSQNCYREISSISNCGDFQARRAGIRYRNEAGKPTFAHTLNGSGLAVGRTLVAILENYQQENGTIEVPKLLRKYMGDQQYISKKEEVEEKQ